MIKNLYSELEANSDSLELLQKSGKIATRILKEYFENIGSPRLLRILNDIVAVVEGCLAKIKRSVLCAGVVVQSRFSFFSDEVDDASRSIPSVDCRGGYLKHLNSFDQSHINNVQTRLPIRLGERNAIEQNDDATYAEIGSVPNTANRDSHIIRTKLAWSRYSQYSCQYFTEVVCSCIFNDLLLDNTRLSRNIF